MQSAVRADVGVKEAALIPVLEELRAGGFVAFDDDGVWRLGWDLSRTSISELVHLLGYGVPMTPELIGKSPAVARLGAVIAEAQAAEKQALQQPVTVLFDKIEQ